MCTACVQALIERPCPLRRLQATNITSTTLSISWEMFNETHHLEIIYGHVVKRCSAPIGLPRKLVIANNSVTSRTLTGLNEDSRYTIIVRAINTEDYTVDTITVDTLTAGENG